MDARHNATTEQVSACDVLEGALARLREAGHIDGRRLNVERLKEAITARARDRPFRYRRPDGTYLSDEECLPSPAVAPLPPPPRAVRTVERPIHEYMLDDAFQGWSVRPGGSRRVVWTLKGLMPDGRRGYMMGEADGHRDALQEAAAALARGTWRVDKFPHLR